MGYLELIIGPMFSGKSTELLRQARRYAHVGKKVLVVNHALNVRYEGQPTSPKTHDAVRISRNAVSARYLRDVDGTDVFLKADIIIVEELQFFPDAYPYVTKWADSQGKIIVAAGLDGDSNRQPFGDVLRLVPVANKVRKLSALCGRCGDGTLADFTLRKSKDHTRTLVGAHDEYEAVCRTHYLRHATGAALPQPTKKTKAKATMPMPANFSFDVTGC